MSSAGVSFLIMEDPSIGSVVVAAMICGVWLVIYVFGFFLAPALAMLSGAIIAGTTWFCSYEQGHSREDSACHGGGMCMASCLIAILVNTVITIASGDNYASSGRFKYARILVESYLEVIVPFFIICILELAIRQVVRLETWMIKPKFSAALPLDDIEAGQVDPATFEGASDQPPSYETYLAEETNETKPLNAGGS